MFIGKLAFNTDPNYQQSSEMSKPSSPIKAVQLSSPQKPAQTASPPQPLPPQMKTMEMEIKRADVIKSARELGAANDVRSILDRMDQLSKDKLSARKANHRTDAFMETLTVYLDRKEHFDTFVAFAVVMCLSTVTPGELLVTKSSLGLAAAVIEVFKARYLLLLKLPVVQSNTKMTAIEEETLVKILASPGTLEKPTKITLSLKKVTNHQREAAAEWLGRINHYATKLEELDKHGRSKLPNRSKEALEKAFRKLKPHEQKAIQDDDVEMEEEQIDCQARYVLGESHTLVRAAVDKILFDMMHIKEEDESKKASPVELLTSRASLQMKTVFEFEGIKCDCMKRAEIEALIVTISENFIAKKVTDPAKKQNPKFSVTAFQTQIQEKNERCRKSANSRCLFHANKEEECTACRSLGVSIEKIKAITAAYKIL